MPVRARRSKRRVGALAPHWEMVFLSGHDYFADLADAGIAVDEYGRPPLEATEAAWRKHGRAFLAAYEGDAVDPWALREFGLP